MSSSGSPDGPGAAVPCQSSPSSSSPSSSSSSSSGCMEALPPVALSSLLARRLLGLQACRSRASPVTRRKREMVPASRKDATYWDKRLKNNRAARRSREKRRLGELMVRGQLQALSEENAKLRAQVLSLQHHRGPRARHSPAGAAASTLPSSPAPARAHALLHAGLWSSQASAVGVRHPFEANIPCLSSSRATGGLNALSPYDRDAPPLCGPRAALEGGGSAEARLDARPRLSPGDDTRSSADASPLHASSIQVFLPTPDTQHPRTSVLSYAAQNWRLPYAGSNFLLPWLSPYAPPPAVYPGLALSSQGRRGQAVGAEADAHPGLWSGFSGARAGLHLSPY